VRKVKGDPSELYAFGKAEDGTVIIIGLYRYDDGGYHLEVFESAKGDEGKGFGKEYGMKMQRKKNK
jgi:hypothetical protein